MQSNKTDNINEVIDKKTKQKNRWIVCWTQQEDQLLFQKYLQIGSKWVQISSFFIEKTDNAVKNRFYCCMRKVQRLMNNFQKCRKIKNRKQINYNSLLSIMQIGKNGVTTEDKRFDKIKQNIDEIMNLRKLIIKVARLPEDIIQDQVVQNLIKSFLKLKYALKFISFDRVQKNSYRSQKDRSEKESIIKEQFLNQDTVEKQEETKGKSQSEIQVEGENAKIVQQQQCIQKYSRKIEKADSLKSIDKDFGATLQQLNQPLAQDNNYNLMADNDKDKFDFLFFM